MYLETFITGDCPTTIVYIQTGYFGCNVIHVGKKSLKLMYIDITYIDLSEVKRLRFSEICGLLAFLRTLSL